LKIDEKQEEKEMMKQNKKPYLNTMTITMMTMTIMMFSNKNLQKKL
jgi:hypothetical protein